MVICLEIGADLHMDQLISLPLTVSCFSKIQIGFPFLVPAHPGSPGQKAVKRVCVCVCACVRACVRACVCVCVCVPVLDYHPSDNFIVGLTDVSPLTLVPSLWNYDVCGQFPGVVPHGGIVIQPCIAEMPPRRYLVIQIERADGVLNFCEVEVFTGSKLISVSSHSSPLEEVKFLASLP